MRALYDELVPLAPSRLSLFGPARFAAGNREPVARLVVALHVAGTVARGCDPLADHVANDDLSSNRRHRRRGDDIAARADRRRAQLGLSLLLAARRDIDPLRLAELGLSQRGARLARMAVAGGCGPSGRNADHVRVIRRTPADRIRGFLVARL